MTQKQVGIVKSSWSIVKTLDPEVVGSLFYGRLFEIAPELKPLFRNPIPEQSKKLLAMLSYVINKLDKLNEVADEVARLGQRHLQYGVKEEHYGIVGEALLLTLKKGVGNSWTDEMEEAWSDCYKILSSAMMEAAAADRQNAA